MFCVYVRVRRSKQTNTDHKQYFTISTTRMHVWNTMRRESYNNVLRSFSNWRIIYCYIDAFTYSHRQESNHTKYGEFYFRHNYVAIETVRCISPLQFGC